MESQKTKCFCCGKVIKDDVDECPHCGAEQVKKLTKEEVELLNKEIGNLKKSTIIGSVIGFIETIIFGSINPNSYLFVFGIIIGIASAYGLSLYYEKKENENNKKNKKDT